MSFSFVFAIGTFPYARRTVAIPWSLDQDSCQLETNRLQKREKKMEEKKKRPFLTLHSFSVTLLPRLSPFFLKKRR